LKDTWKKDDKPAPSAADSADKYKQEIDDLKKEIETLKSDKA
jgi:cell division protein FtsB